uniref:SWIM-type zinc finger 7 associated protein 1 n=1 Tax=Cyprinodon variegatus TaxID=28743 RepID=A0A3Q2E4R4_CYPVA
MGDSKQLRPPLPPSLIIIDRLDGFLRDPGLSCAAHLAALLCDTAAFLTEVLQQRGPSSAPCRVIASFLSDVDGDGPARRARCARTRLDPRSFSPLCCPKNLPFAFFHFLIAWAVSRHAASP